jgi:hypothetical protein
MNGEVIQSRKVPVLLEKRHPWDEEQRERGEGKTERLTMALPFYRSLSSGGRAPVIDGVRTRYIHRVRSGRMYFRKSDETGAVEFSHTGLLMWCGSTGSIGAAWRKGKPRGEMFAADNLPEKAVFCATCEGRAAGAGMCERREINGRFVMFQPRV